MVFERPAGSRMTMRRAADRRTAVRNVSPGLGRLPHDARHVMGERPYGADIAAGRQEQEERAIGFGVAQGRRRDRPERAERRGDLASARGRLDVEQVGLVALFTRCGPVVERGARAGGMRGGRLAAAELEQRDAAARGDRGGEHRSASRQGRQRGEDEDGARTPERDLIDRPRRPSGPDERQKKRGGSDGHLVVELPATSRRAA